MSERSERPGDADDEPAAGGPSDESVQEFVEELENDPAYSPDDEELKREKGG